MESNSSNMQLRDSNPDVREHLANLEEISSKNEITSLQRLKVKNAAAFCMKNIGKLSFETREIFYEKLQDIQRKGQKNWDLTRIFSFWAPSKEQLNEKIGDVIKEFKPFTTQSQISGDLSTLQGRITQGKIDTPYVSLMKQCLGSDIVNQRDRDTTLLGAVLESQALSAHIRRQEVALLIKKGANVNQLSGKRLPLSIALSLRDGFDIAGVLMDSGKLVLSKKGDKGQTVLSSAMKVGPIEAVRWLLCRKEVQQHIVKLPVKEQAQLLADSVQYGGEIALGLLRHIPTEQVLDVYNQLEPTAKQAFSNAVMDNCDSLSSDQLMLVLHLPLINQEGQSWLHLLYLDKLKLTEDALKILSEVMTTASQLEPLRAQDLSGKTPLEYVQEDATFLRRLERLVKGTYSLEMMEMTNKEGVKALLKRTIEIYAKREQNPDRILYAAVTAALESAKSGRADYSIALAILRTDKDPEYQTVKDLIRDQPEAFACLVKHASENYPTALIDILPEEQLVVECSKTDSNGNTLLHNIAKSGSSPFLLHAIAKLPLDDLEKILRKQDQSGNTVVALAAEKGMKDVFEALRKRHPGLLKELLMQSNKLGEKPLILALQNKQGGIVTMILYSYEGLLEVVIPHLGKRIDDSDMSKDLAAWIAPQMEGGKIATMVEVMSLFEEPRYCIELMDKKEVIFSMLKDKDQFESALKNHPEAIHHLLGSIADYRKHSWAHLLIQKGITVPFAVYATWAKGSDSTAIQCKGILNELFNLRNNRGNTLMHHALLHKRFDLFDVLSNESIMDFLNKTNASGESPLFYALDPRFLRYKDLVPLLKKLKERGLALDDVLLFQDPNQATILHKMKIDIDFIHTLSEVMAPTKLLELIIQSDNLGTTVFSIAQYLEEPRKLEVTDALVEAMLRADSIAGGQVLIELAKDKADILKPLLDYINRNPSEQGDQLLSDLFKVFTEKPPKAISQDTYYHLFSGLIKSGIPAAVVFEKCEKLWPYCLEMFSKEPWISLILKDKNVLDKLLEMEGKRELSFIFHAASFGADGLIDVLEVDQLLEQLSRVGLHGYTPLHCAVEGETSRVFFEKLIQKLSPGHLVQLEELLSKKNNDGLTVLQLAISHDFPQYSVFQILQSQAPELFRSLIVKQSSQDETLLAMAFKAKRVETVKSIVKPYKGLEAVLMPLMGRSIDADSSVQKALANWVEKNITQKNTAEMLEVVGLFGDKAASQVIDRLMKMPRKEAAASITVLINSTDLMKEALTTHPTAIRNFLLCHKGDGRNWAHWLVANGWSAPFSVLTDLAATDDCYAEMLDEILAVKTKGLSQSLAHLAIQNKNGTFFECVAKMKPETIGTILGQKDRSGRTAFLKGILSQDAEVLDTLMKVLTQLKGENLDRALMMADPEGVNILGAAISIHNPQIIRQLREVMMPKNFKRLLGQPLHETTTTPLSLAKGKEEIIKILLHDYCLQSTSLDDLVAAINREDLPVVQRLMLLDIPRLLGNKEMQKKLQEGISQGTMKTLLKDPNNIEKLHSLSPENLAIVLKLHPGGGVDALSWAAENGRSAIYKNIYELDSDLFFDLLQQTDGDGMTPLHRAAQAGNAGAVETITTLLEGDNADLLWKCTQMKNRAGHTPLDIAKMANRTQVVNVLETRIYRPRITQELDFLYTQLVEDRVALPEGVPLDALQQEVRRVRTLGRQQQVELAAKRTAVQQAMLEEGARKRQLKELRDPFILPTGDEVNKQRWTQTSNGTLAPAHFAKSSTLFAVPKADENVDIRYLNGLCDKIVGGLPDTSTFEDDGVPRSRVEVVGRFKRLVNELSLPDDSRSALYDTTMTNQLRQTARNTLRHLTQKLQRRESELALLQDPKAQQKVLEEAELILLQGLGIGAFHCVDRLGLECTNIYVNYIVQDPTLQSNQSVETVVLHKLSAIRTALLTQAISSVVQQNRTAITAAIGGRRIDDSTIASYYLKQLGKECGVSTELLSQDNPYASFVPTSLNLERQIREQFWKSYTPQSIVATLHGILVQGNDEQLKTQKVQEWFEEHFKLEGSQLEVLYDESGHFRPEAIALLAKGAGALDQSFGS